MENNRNTIAAHKSSTIVMKKNIVIDTCESEKHKKPFTIVQLKGKRPKSLITKSIGIGLEKGTSIFKNLIDNELDQESLDDFFSDDKDFMKIVFEAFIDEIDLQVVAFYQLNKEEKWEEVAMLAHKMKPSFGMVGLIKTKELLKCIESDVKTAGINEDIKMKIQLFIDAIPTLVNLVKAENNK